MMPKGRQTIRKGGSLAGGGRRIKLWEFDSKPNTTIAGLEAAYMAGLSAVDRIEERTRRNAANGKFTPAGVKDDALKFALSDLVPVLHRGRAAIKKARAEVAERREKLVPPTPDKNDIAAAFRRMEIRTRLRELKSDELTNYFARYGDNLPTEIAQAVTELPAEYSGVPQSRHDLLTERALESQFGGALEEIREVEQAIEAAESSVEAARDEVRIEVGMHDVAKFNQLAAPIEQKHDAPWLKKFKENGNEVVRVIVPGEAHSPKVATPEEIASGIFYENYDDYVRRAA